MTRPCLSVLLEVLRRRVSQPFQTSLDDVASSEALIYLDHSDYLQFLFLQATVIAKVGSGQKLRSRWSTTSRRTEPRRNTVSRPQT